MTTYRVNVTREDRWWIIDVPALEGHVTIDGSINIGTSTQARRYADIETEARDFICTVADAAPSTVSLDVHITVDGLDVVAAAAEVHDLKDQAANYEQQARESQVAVAQRLSHSGLAVRDIGEILGLTYQRAHQLIAR